MFTLAGWHENIDAATLDYITALADPHLTVSGDNIVVPTLNNIMGLYAIGANMTQARIESPSLRRLALLDIAPVDRATKPGQRSVNAFQVLASQAAADSATFVEIKDGSGAAVASTTKISNAGGGTDFYVPSNAINHPTPDELFHDYFDMPIPLDVSESVQAKIAEDGSTTRNTVLIWFGDKIDPVPAGRLIHVRCTSSTTLTAYAWTNGSLTFSQSLPAGRYAIIGARAYSAGLIAFRLVIPGIWQRPGAIGVANQYAASVSRFRVGGAGSWGEFEHNLPPTVDFLSVSADTSEVVHLDLIQVRAGAA
jgi:hypothetical protein